MQHHQGALEELLDLSHCGYDKAHHLRPLSFSLPPPNALAKVSTMAISWNSMPVFLHQRHDGDHERVEVLLRLI
jgi:hypothetical protein